MSDEPACAECWQFLRLRYACACRIPLHAFLPLEEFRRQAVLTVLRREQSMNKTAQVLGISRETVRRIIRQEAA